MNQNHRTEDTKRLVIFICTAVCFLLYVLFIIYRNNNLDTYYPVQSAEFTETLRIIKTKGKVGLLAWNEDNKKIQITLPNYNYSYYFENKQNQMYCIKYRKTEYRSTSSSMTKHRLIGLDEGRCFNSSEN